MSMETNGTTNGAPKGKKNTSLTMLAGDFLSLLSQEQNLGKSVSSQEFRSLREDDVTINIGLEPNTNKDIIFLEFLEKYPIMANAKKTREEWDKLLTDYMNSKNGKKEMDID